MGLESCFHDPQCFSGATAAPLIVDAAVQETVVEIDERGVKAAAVTAVSMTRGMPGPAPVVAHFDRPFGFAVVDPESGLVLFAGWLADPSDSG